MYTIVRRRCWASTSLRVHSRTYAAPAVEAQRLESLARKLIKKGVEERDVTDEVSGRQRRRGFESTIKFTSGRPPSTEVGDVSNSNVDYGWDDSRNEFDLQPGDYLELGGPNHNSTCGVVLGQRYRGRQLHTITLTEDGNVLYHLGDMVQFSIPGLISSDLASRCGSEMKVVSDHQHKARLRVIKYLTQLSPTIRQATFDAQAGLNDAYELLRNKDPDQRAATTLSHLTRMFKKKPTFVDLIAVQRFVSQDSASYIPRRDFAVSHAILIRSLNEKSRLDTIHSWISQRSSPLDTFALKARPFMDRVVALRRETYLEPPSVLESPSSPSWDENDILILRYLVDSCLSAYDEFPTAYAVGMSNILKRLYDHATLYAHALGFEALVDLGIVPPWQDATVHINPLFDKQVEAMITKHIEKYSSPTSNAAILNPTSQPLGQEDFYPSDPMESVRHDFGDMPVYVIDESSAKELDDGVSFEPIPGDPHGGWLHVHVADPCSIIPPTHALASLAEERHMSRYHPLIFDSMLPSALTGPKGFGMSLGSKDGPQRVLTFSAKVSSNGDIVDYKVRSGFVNNLVVISYDTVDHLMNFPTAEAKYPFGRPLGRDIQPATLTERHRADLRALYDIATNLVARRFRDGVFVSNESKGVVVVAASPEEMPPPVSIPGKLYKGFPSFTMAVKEPLTEDVGARSMVAEAMKMAGRVASIFCLERNIPILRRVLSTPPLHPGLDSTSFLEHRSPGGYVNRIEAIPFLDYDLKSTYTLQPGAHWTVGAQEGQGYARATSPLRRYLDMMSHWQIHASLRGEKSIYSKDELLVKAELSAITDRWHKREEGRNNVMWQMMFVERWNNQPLKDIPNPLDDLRALVMDVPTHHPRRMNYVAPVHLPELGIRATVVNLKNITDVKFGQMIKVNNLVLNKGYHASMWLDYAEY